jgi:hypothetical protein
MLNGEEIIAVVFGILMLLLAAASMWQAHKLAELRRKSS